MSPGDAIGNYIISLRRLLLAWGARVEVYADRIAPAYRWLVRPTLYYPSGACGLLWYHYSIYSENVSLLNEVGCYRLLDYHGISPPQLYAGDNEELAALCRRGQEALPAAAARSDYLVTHSSYTTNELHRLGLERICEYPLFVDTAHFEGEDHDLAPLLDRSQYLLFVGRIVPQKDIDALLEIFAHVLVCFPDHFLVLAGARDLSSHYQLLLADKVRKLRLTGRVLFTGQVNNPSILAAIYRHARLTVVASQWESFCVPVAESLYFATPVAVNDVPPLPEVAGPGGIVFNSRERVEAATKICTLLQDGARYQALREAAQSQARRYSGTALSENVSRLLQKIVDDTTNPAIRESTYAAR